MVTVAIGTALVVKSKGGFATAPVPVTCSVDAAQFLGYINAERAKLGAPQLVTDSKLAVSSHNKLQDMVSGHYYGHNLLDGSSTFAFLSQQGVHESWSEDLDLNGMTPLSDWTTLKNSPPHYASLTNPLYTRVGIDTQCVAFTIEHGTGPDDNSKLVGSSAKELTVIHLAAPEPVQAPQVTAKPQASSCYTTSTPAEYVGGVFIPGYATTKCY